MLTEEEKASIIAEVERDEWDPAVWKVTDRGSVFHVKVCEEQIPKLVARARDNGKTTDEYLSGLVDAILATA